MSELIRTFAVEPKFFGLASSGSCDTNPIENFIFSGLGLTPILAAKAGFAPSVIGHVSSLRSLSFDITCLTIYITPNENRR